MILFVCLFVLFFSLFLLPDLGFGWCLTTEQVLVVLEVVVWWRCGVLMVQCDWLWCWICWDARVFFFLQICFSPRSGCFLANLSLRLIVVFLIKGIWEFQFTLVRILKGTKHRKMIFTAFSCTQSNTMKYIIMKTFCKKYFQCKIYILYFKIFYFKTNET